MAPRHLKLNTNQWLKEWQPVDSVDHTLTKSWRQKRILYKGHERIEKAGKEKTTSRQQIIKKMCKDSLSKKINKHVKPVLRIKR